MFTPENARTQVNFGALMVAVVRLSSGADARPTIIRARRTTLAGRKSGVLLYRQGLQNEPRSGLPAAGGDPADPGGSDAFDLDRIEFPMRCRIR